MDKPVLSPNFTVEDIRKLRNYNHERRMKMTPAELSRDIQEGAKEGYRILAELKKAKKTRQGV